MSEPCASPRAAVLLLRALVTVALMAASGCATVHKWKQEHHEASLHRQQTEEAAARENGSKADRAESLRQAQEAARLPRLQDELVARGDAESLAAAALIQGQISGFSSGTALDLAARAVAAAPDRTDLMLLQMQLCEGTPTCDPLPLERRLLVLDPENGIPWVYALLRADREHRPADWEAARSGLAQAKRVDLYWNRTVSHLAKAVTGKAGFNANAAFSQVIGAEASFITALQPISRACQAQEIKRPEALVQCRRIAMVLRHADTTLLEANGSSVAMRVWPAGSAERREVISERRALRYRVDLMTRYAKQLNSPQAIDTLAGLIAQYPTEQAAMRALYVHQGLKPDPPTDWVDPQPDG
ncbi:MAG TPA: hypothetical protein VGM97_17360 [Steroidobacteraceae bacterium]